MGLYEDDFWKRLEYRVCDEFAGLDVRRLRHLWCDGLTPIEYLIDDVSPRICGTAWIGDRQNVWQFTLLLPSAIADCTTFDWSTLLPSAGVTSWMTPEPDKRRLTMEPGVATRDGP